MINPSMSMRQGGVFVCSKYILAPLVTKVERIVTKEAYPNKSLRVEIKNGDSYYRQQTDEE
ncbi:hypothetical protein DD607_34525, partial [Salmonella sp. 3DZ2-4SM]